MRLNIYHIKQCSALKKKLAEYTENFKKSYETQRPTLDALSLKNFGFDVKGLDFVYFTEYLTVKRNAVCTTPCYISVKENMAKNFIPFLLSYTFLHYFVLPIIFTIGKIRFFCFQTLKIRITIKVFLWQSFI